MGLTMLISMLVILWVLPSHALIGFDCHHPDIKIRVLSLNGVNPCPSIQESSTVEKVNLQLLQRKETQHIPYVQCYISTTTIVQHCGMHSHISAVAGGYVERMLPITYSECREIILSKSYRWDHDHTTRMLPINSTYTESFTLVGHVTTDGQCRGGHYNANGREYQNVIVTIAARFRISTGLILTNLEDNTVRLPDGGLVDYSKGQALDYNGGYTFWDNAPVPTECSAEYYDVLYEGEGMKLTSMEEGAREVMVVEEEGATFSLEIKDHLTICNRFAYSTEHPRLVISINGINAFKGRRSTELLDISLTSYINAKFVYVERHIRKQIESLYTSVKKHTCEIERKGLLNTLSLASINEDEFAYSFTGERGHTSVRRGEVAYLIDCVAVPLNVRQTESCYSDLPVFYKNTSLFMSAKTGILKKYGTEIECMDLMPVWYQIDSSWYNVYGSKMTKGFQPIELTPGSNLHWSYETPKSLASSGIYSESELKKLEHSLIFPGERESVLDHLSRGYMGHDVSIQGHGLSSLMTPRDLQEITKNIFSRMWGFLSIIGQVSSGFIGIYVMIRLIKVILSTILNCTMLHQSFGFSLKLLAGIWTNATHFLLHMTRPHKPRASDREDLTDDASIPLTSVVTTDPSEEQKTLHALVPPPTVSLLYPSAPNPEVDFSGLSVKIK